jgi:hypothetical protein
MKYSLIAASLAALLATTACNESAREDAKDVRASQGAVAKDNKAIAEQDRNLAVNRAQKADAKARGDYVSQAGESLQIGANKVAKSAKKVEKEADTQILQEDKEDLTRH